MKKVIEAKGKMSLQPCTTIQRMNQHCFRGSRLAYTTVAKTSTLNSFIKDPKVKKPKIQT